MWINIVEPDRPQMPLWRTRTVCWIRKATDRHSEYVIHIAFPLQQRLDDRAKMLRYVYIACLIIRLRTMLITVFLESDAI